VDLASRPPWSNTSLRKLGAALRDGREPPDDSPSYADVMLWHADLGAEVHEQIENGSWAVADELEATAARRIGAELRVSSRPKTIDTLVEKLRRRPTQQLNTVQDLAGVRIDADLLLEEQTALAREIATHFGAEENAVHDLRSGEHAGYRGVHVWIRKPAGRVEVQIRTLFQSIWANLYERIADTHGRGIRYGEPLDESWVNGDLAELQRTIDLMAGWSASMAETEAVWQEIAEIDDWAQRAWEFSKIAMNRAMGFAAITAALRGDVSAAEVADFVRRWSGKG
jgi:ppGpp synthetase/RelA/SpoT-type nucleotidyltranferase